MSRTLTYLALPNAKSKLPSHLIGVGVMMASGTIVLSVLVVVWIL